MSWKLIRRISAVAIATLAGASAYTYAFSSEPKLKATPFLSSINYASEISPSSGWDYNWDHRGCTENNATLDKQQSKAIRHIILIRHGQFIRNCSTEPECILTELGRQQAKFTGQRIAEMEFPINNVVVSPLTRAQETSQIIMEQLPHLKDIPIKTEPMIEEGAPFEPGTLWNLLLNPNLMPFPTLFSSPCGLFQSTAVGILPARQPNRGWFPVAHPSCWTISGKGLIHYARLSWQHHSLLRHPSTSAANRGLAALRLAPRIDHMAHRVSRWKSSSEAVRRLRTPE